MLIVDGFFSLAGGTLEGMWQNLSGILPNLITIAIALVVLFVVYKILTMMIHHALVKTVRVKSEMKMVMGIWRYVFFFLAFIVLISTFSGDLATTGLSIGLLSAALGLALQRPITGVIAWMMILVKKPFKVGDRVIIDNIKGDITDITMFHIVLAEAGGTVGAEDTSGRTILIPTALLFEKPITNYTMSNAFILDEVASDFTYESSLQKAEKIVLDAAKKFTKESVEKTGKQPFTRISFAPSSVHVKVCYNVVATERPQAMTDITREIHNKVMQEKDVEFAYPHTKLVFGEKPLKMQGEKQLQ